MPTKGSLSSEHIRVSVSSTHSATSSLGSNTDDSDSFGEIYIWGETLTLINSQNPNSLLPKPLESNLVLDARNISCGSKHASLITRNGEIFTWGEERSGRLGHGLVGNDVIAPTLIDTLSNFTFDSVSCGELHNCAITNLGYLYTWGLCHGKDDVANSHWFPKWVPGLIVTQVSCGTYHTALITNTGQLFTFGDGLFGVLGHGNRDSVSHPKEVESLSGLRTNFVSCGVWHTAAVVEVISSSNGNPGNGNLGNGSSGKLFTWGDGDKNRLGHGDREPRLKPTCVASLIDYNFQKIACGHSLTLGLTTTGQVLTMGSSVYGQLGNPRYDGRLPCLVEDNLSGETVCEISCGAYHVAILTSKGEVFTWGKGANGRLGHGDSEDKKVPTLVHSLKDKSVRQIACGTNFTACVCLRRWVPGTEQTQSSQCTNCRVQFGFKRKRHHCYNCGLALCHSCCSKKALGAELAPNPGKLFRVCDLCYAKLVGKTSSGNMDIIRSLDLKAVKQFGFLNSSRANSPLSRKSSPPCCATPVPASLSLSRAVVPVFLSKAGTESLRKTNEVLTQEVEKLRLQVENLKQKCELHEAELQKSVKKVQEAVILAAEESAKSKAAKEVIKSLTAQLKEMAERLPQDSQEESERKSWSANETEEDNFMDRRFHDETSTSSSSAREMDPQVQFQNGDVGSRVRVNPTNQVETEWIEQYEPGVYITLTALRDGTRDLKRVRFSRRRFGEHQAESWWWENREKVYEKYNVRATENVNDNKNRNFGPL